MSFFTYKSKRIFYSEAGNGQPLVMLHGDAVSSKMFELLTSLYEPNFHLIFIDFLGCGQSDRVHTLPADLWYSQVDQVIALFDHLHYEQVDVVGTSGGAWVAMESALTYPHRIRKVVADSFDGRTLASDFAEKLYKEREYAKADELARQFYEWCHGSDWEEVVDANTKALLACANLHLPLFHGNLKDMKRPVLLMGSREDTMCRSDMIEELQAIKEQLFDARLHVFEQGDHPAIVTNAEAAAAIITSFLKEE